MSENKNDTDNDNHSKNFQPQQLLRVDFGKKKKKTTTTFVAAEFTADQVDSSSKAERERQSVTEFSAQEAAATAAPLVIPAVPNSFGHFRDQYVSSTREVKRELGPIKLGNENNDEDVDEDAKAIQALQEEAKTSRDKGNGGAANSNTKQNLVIHGSADRFQQQKRSKPKQDDDKETQQFHRDLAALPEAMDVSEYHKSRVTISEFGAAMLRGMGWTGQEDKNEKTNKDAEFSLPRPHRLGLGATPKLENNGDDDDNNNNNGNSHVRRRPRTMDQYERDKKIRQQAQEFAKQRQEQILVDKQQTMQNGSLVWVAMDNRTRDDGSDIMMRSRAKMIQMVGVPGLNMVRVWLEQEAKLVDIKRNQVERLVSRQELQELPFEDQKATAAKPSNRSGDENDGARDDNIQTCRDASRNRYNDRRRSKDKAEDQRQHRRSRDDYNDESFRDRKRRREREPPSSFDKRVKIPRDDEERNSRKPTPMSSTWVIPQIRVRLVTEKLGRRYFKEKGIVVDVTPKGCTVELPSSLSSSGRVVVLDRVPERYLETALPKAGGRVIVLGGSGEAREHLYSKGTLLERGKGRGVVQLDVDKSVLTLSLDDLAEWVGPPDDE